MIGFVLALWTLTGSMNALMRAINSAYGRRETRGFIRQRLTALAMIACLVLAAALVICFLVLGPVLSGAVGNWLGMQSAIGWIWWTVQWPVLLLGLLTAFATIYVLAPESITRASTSSRRDRARRRHLAGRLGGLLRVRRDVRVLQQDLGIARRRDRADDLALAERARTAPRRGDQLRGRAEPRAALAGFRPRTTSSSPTATGKAPETATRTQSTAHANGSRPLRAPAVAMTGVLALALWALRGSRESSSTRS